MRKVLFVGGFTDEVGGFIEAMSEFFSVQLCPPLPEMVSGMMKIIKPEMAVVHICGVPMDFVNIIRLMSKENEKMPVLSLVHSGDMGVVENACVGEQYSKMELPAMSSAVIEQCRSILDSLKNSEDNDVPVTFVPVLKKVLVVDDNVIMLRTIKEQLFGKYEVTLANSGAKALDKVEEFRPDVILMDYEMPVMDGRTAFQKIKQIPECADIPVVFLTAVSDKERVLEVLKDSPAGYILKPASTEAMVEAIEKALAKARS